MRQVVIVAPQFPPSNLTAGHRCRYFAMHLPKFGWKVKVLSVEPSYYEEKLDAELEKLLPPDLEVIRTKALKTRPLRLIGDIGIRAFWWHYRALCDLARREKPDLIYIPIPPNYSAMLGLLIYRKFGIPYAIDYIDPWVHPWPGCEVLFTKPWWAYQLGRILEPLALKHVLLITAVAPGYYEGPLRRYPWIGAQRCLAIPYGAEQEDFQYLDKQPRSTYIFSPSDGNLHIVYAGAMLPRAYSTLEALLEAILILQKSYPALARRMRFHFIGTGSKPFNPKSFTILPLVQRYGLSGIVSERPMRIPYLDVLNHLKGASAVLLLGSSEPHYTPSKVFQAILSGRPTIALLHRRSTAVNIIEETGAGTVVAFDETKPADKCVEEIASAIYNTLIGNYSAGNINWELFRAYSAGEMARRLAGAFDSALDS